MQRVIWAIAFLACSLSAQDVKRPRITGVAHIALYVHDVDKSRAFYKDLLGFDEPFWLNATDAQGQPLPFARPKSMKPNDGGKLSMTFIKINDRQYIELAPEVKPGTDRLLHISVETDDAEALRLYLKSHGYTASDTPARKVRIGNTGTSAKDVDGHGIDIVQYEPDGWSMLEKGKYMSDARVSNRMLHVGFTVRELEPALKFYRDTLGFTEFWRGSRDGKYLSYVNLKVPEGNDYVEFILVDQPPSLAELGVMNHLALEVPDMERAISKLKSKPAFKDYSRPLEVRTGKNRKRQLNLFDPDGTRVELMESKTVDGLPAPSSTAPALR